MTLLEEIGKGENVGLEFKEARPKDKGLPAPDVAEEAGFFKIVFYRAPKGRSVGEGVNDGVNEGVNDGVNEGVSDGVNSVICGCLSNMVRSSFAGRRRRAGIIESAKMKPLNEAF